MEYLPHRGIKTQNVRFAKIFTERMRTTATLN